MKRLVLIISLICFLVPYTDAQVWVMKRYQLTAGAGFAQEFCDIGGYSQGKNAYGLKDFSISQQRFDINLNFKYRLSKYFNARLSMTYAMLHASDVKGSNELRQLESTTSLFEPALLAEYYFVKPKYERSLLSDKGSAGFFTFIDFYAFTGIGAAFYSSKGNAELVSRGLAPGGVTPVVPVGLGVNLDLTPDINLGLELGTRFSFTDNLDGYDSQYSSTNDVYYFLNFTFTYKLKTGPHNMPSFR